MIYELSVILARIAIADREHTDDFLLQQQLIGRETR